MLMSLFVLPVYDGAKMERVSEVLQLPVIVEGRRPLALELQPLEKLDFLRGRRAAERRILEEFLEPGLQEFLQDSSLSGTATAKEVEFLKRLKFQGQRPTPLYYYRELQNLRDPLHFRTVVDRKNEEGHEHRAQ